MHATLAQGVDKTLAEWAFHDELTGLYNRRAFQELGRREVARAHRYGRELSMIYFDLDDFKRFNDTFGHSAGDEVLVNTATCVAGQLRSSDMFCRLGGDEFLILLPETSIQRAVFVARRIRYEIAKMVVDFTTQAVTISAGVATLEEGDNLTTLTEWADAGMYAAKEAGRNCVICIQLASEDANATHT